MLLMSFHVCISGLEHNFPSEQKYGIWNGDEFVYKESSWYIASMAKLFYRYGFQLYRLKRYFDIVPCNRLRKSKIILLWTDI